MARDHRRSDHLEAIAAAPDDDAVRLVFADWLIERGDPLGEFIQLQIARHRSGGELTKRELEILKKCEAQLPGSLAGVASDIAWARGFIWACSVDTWDDAARRTLGHPLWSTVHSLRAGPGAVALALHPIMRSLRSLTIPGGDLALLLAATLPIETLNTRTVEAPGPTELRWLKTLPALRRLEVADATGDHAWWFTGRFAEQLEELSLDVGFRERIPIARWLDWMAPTRLARLDTSLLHIERAGERFSLRIDVRSYLEDEIVAAFAGLAPERVATLTLALREIAFTQRRRLEEALARFAPVMV